MYFLKNFEICLYFAKNYYCHNDVKEPQTKMVKCQLVSDCSLETCSGYKKKNKKKLHGTDKTLGF